MTESRADPVEAPPPAESDRELDRPGPSEKACSDDPLTASIRDYLALVEDVAVRYARLPVEHVVRALRRQLSGFGPEETEIRALAQRISCGQL
jgi:hypothetical protein